MNASAAFPSFTFPERKTDAIGGKALVQTLTPGPGEVREREIFQQVSDGNLPNFMRTPELVSFDTTKGNVCFAVLPDYLCVGTDDDFVRVPMFPTTAQRIANILSATMPTRFLVNQIWKLATIHLAPLPMSLNREATATFMEHNRYIESQKAQRGGLIAGHKKDIVLTKGLFSYSENVAIYGWHQLDGKPIQPLNYTSHNRHYVDYSHGVRLVSRSVLLNGEPVDFIDLLKDPARSVVVSDEGILPICAYPLE